MSSLISVTQAAARLGISRQAAQQRIDIGTLPARKISGTWVIDLSDIHCTCNSVNGFTHDAKCRLATEEEAANPKPRPGEFDLTDAEGNVVAFSVCMCGSLVQIDKQSDHDHYIEHYRNSDND